MVKYDDIRQFINDDEAYLRWLEQNPQGLVVNSARVPTAAYLILHRASCGSLRPTSRGNWTTSDYIKTCSVNPRDLARWAVDETGGALHPCGLCKPIEVLNIPQASSGAILPPTITTGCPELDRAWEIYAPLILDRTRVMIPDTDEDLNWHAFLGHSIDMQGFRAAEFAGVDPLTRKAHDFVPLKERGLGVRELASLWDVPGIRSHLTGNLDGVSFEATLDVLRGLGGATGASLAEAFTRFPWRKFHWSARALIQNSAALGSFGFSFREWLRVQVLDLGGAEFPPSNFQLACSTSEGGNTLEQALKSRLQRTFYKVGPAMSSYMLCDWQLWLWNEGRTRVFANFKLDSFHEEFVRKFGRGVIPADEAGFARWWLDLYPELPPRLPNECVWLAIENNSNV